LEKVAKFSDFSYSLGLVVGDDGKLDDVIVGSPAYRAGLSAGMKLVAVNHRKWSTSVLRSGLQAAKQGDQPIELLVENAQFFKTYPVAYHEGEKNPHLERVSSEPDILSSILKPLAP
jgi:predicted metalloprotease with PDZ domain